MSYQTQLLVVMISYMTLLILWGIYQGRKVKNSSDYAIAGRKLPGWVAALSERATGESAWALLGLPGAAYATGLMEVWTALGCVLGIITAWAVISWKLRDASEKFEVNTFTEFIAKRHGESEKYIRLIGSMVIIFFFFLYVGAQFIGGGKILHDMFEINIWIGVLITFAIVVPYTIYGGFQSVVYTDVVQAIIMIIALIIGPIVGFIYLADHPELYAQSVSGALSKAGTSYTNMFDAGKGFAGGIAIAGGFSWFFGYLGGQPQLSMRFLAIEDKKQAKKARNIGIIWTIIAYIGALSIGWIGIAIFGPDTLPDQEMVMQKVLLKLFPPVIAAVLITGIIAALVSTANSLLILSATELNESFIKTLLKNNKKAGSLTWSRTITAALSLIALVVAYFAPSDLIFNLVGYVWAGIGGTFSVVILLTLFWKKYHGKAVIATIIIGVGFTIFWIGGGYESHYRLTDNGIKQIKAENLLNDDVIQKLTSIKDEKIVTDFTLENKISELVDEKEIVNTVSVVKSVSVNKGLTSRILTFFIALITAVLSTFLLSKPKKINTREKQ